MTNYNPFSQSIPHINGTYVLRSLRRPMHFTHTPTHTLLMSSQWQWYGSTIQVSYKMAYHHHGLRSYSSAWYSWNRIFYQIFLHVIICEFSLRISYGDCNRTARACMNSGQQVLLSHFFEHLRTRLVMSLRQLCVLHNYVMTKHFSLTQSSSEGENTLVKIPLSHQ